ncbi:monovalent cation:H+ antiporter, CPA1 family [Microbacterium sp. cf046]|uniref:cation:proton antiporter n=1 Tax=Microbacterium sp. cf046 TaxID=1761803 RepID=UPI0008EA4599|nr:sodium:proton antiporter [Microbacterium sp. cf046]SFR90271.1 monovalent cation:H+ antiporter, CPA1 family [Microbacterium sp. cf046]
MEALVVAVVGVVVIALATALAPKVGIAGPLALVAIGIGVSLLPFFPAFEVDPEIILVGVLPPLLYSSAVSLPAIEFRRDFRPIAGLSILLVLVSTAALALFFVLVIPGIDLYLAIALGALLSPTDAVATSIVKKLGISPRVVTMLEGESLLNDATSLVLLRTAIAAIAVGSVPVGGALWAFVWGVVIAVVIGALVGLLALRVRTWVGHSAANTALSFVVPFVAYLPTEQLGGSGLVAAVVAGIVTGQGAARWFTPEQRLSDELNWRTVELMLEGAVFLVMGLQLKEIVRANIEDHEGLWHGAWLAGAAIGIILIVRAAYVSVLVSSQGRRARRFNREHLESFNTRIDEIEARGSEPRADGRGRGSASPERREKRLQQMRTRVSRTLADLDYYQASPLGWRHGTVIVWAGMRGVVTLAAAQTLPQGPIQALLVFVAFLVAVGSLMLQGFTLPWVVRWLGLEGSGGSGPSAEEQKRLDEEMRMAAASSLTGGALTRRDGTAFSSEMVDVVGSRMTQPPDDDMTAYGHEMLELRLAMIGVMRVRLNALSRDGAFSTAALRHALAELDADQLSLELRLDDEL